jgi:hypothetical protein
MGDFATKMSTAFERPIQMDAEPFAEFVNIRKCAPYLRSACPNDNTFLI